MSLSENIMIPKRRFIDIGAKLVDPTFRGHYHSGEKHPPDIDRVLSRAFENGISKIIITGMSLESSHAAIDMARSDDRLFATVGVHPTYCNSFCNDNGEEYTDSLKKLIRDNSDKVVAFGEFGLDYARLEFTSKAVQQKYFLHQWEISREFDLPLFLHMRNASEDFLNFLEVRNGTFRGVVRSFDDTLDSMNRILKMGLYIGINACSMKTDDNLSVIKQIPLERLLIETDSPLCDIKTSSAAYKYIKTFYPSVRQEKWNGTTLIRHRNEPCNVVQIFEVLAAIREEDPDHIEKQIYKNTEDLFFSNG